MTYCDFKPGDDVVCVEAHVAEGPLPDLSIGAHYVVRDVYPIPDWMLAGRRWVGNGEPPRVAIFLRGHTIAYPAFWFRKVQRRDLSAWLGTAATDTDHLDKPIQTPARPKVDALLKRVQSGAFG